MLRIENVSFLFYGAILSYSATVDNYTINGQFTFYGGLMRINISVIPPAGPVVQFKLNNNLAVPAYVPVSLFSTTK